MNRIIHGSFGYGIFIQAFGKSYDPTAHDMQNISQRKLDFCLTVHHQLGKVIQMNQLDATMIY